jgi:hypothetical protein
MLGESRSAEQRSLHIQEFRETPRGSDLDPRPAIEEHGAESHNMWE